MSGLPSTACSLSTAAVDEPAYGSAAPARSWVVLEQPGPWGHDAIVESHLDPGLGRALRSLVGSAGGRLVLVRDPGRHPDTHPGHVPRVAITSSVAGASWQLTGEVESPDQLRDMDFQALTDGDADGVRASMPSLQRSDRPQLLVCTNGRRDVCCAVFGRPLAHDARIHRPGQVWETSHTGGHRFSPTAVLLPWGITLARLDLRTAMATLDESAQGRLPLEMLGPQHDRGRSSLPPPAQAAESTVRASIHETRIEAFTTMLADAPDGWDATVHHVDGRTWQVAVTRVPGAGLRAPSCSKAPEPYVTYSAAVTASATTSDATTSDVTTSDG